MALQGVDGERVQYIPFDFHFHSKQRGAQVLAEITPTVQTALAQTGIFACPPALPSPDAHRLAAATWVGASLLTAMAFVHVLALIALVHMGLGGCSAHVCFLRI